MAGTKEFAVAALARGETREQAAAAAGVTPRTLRRWASDPAFAAEIREQRQHLLERDAGRLAHLREGALAALSVLVQSEHESVRLRAIQLVLDQSTRFHAETQYWQREADQDAQIADLQELAGLVRETTT